MYRNALPPGGSGEALFVGSCDGECSATTRPDGRKRVIYFGAGKAVGADLYIIPAGSELYETPEAVIGGV